MIVPLLDHLWQSTLFALGAGLLALLLRKNRARVRSWVWFAASLKFLFPFVALASLGAFLFPASHLPTPVLNALLPAAQPFALPSIPIKPASTSFTAIDWSLIVLIVWALGTSAIALHWLARWNDLRATLRRSTDMQLPGPLPVRSVPTAVEPGLYGIFRPIILMPDGIANHLSSEELSAVLSHETFHRRHCDNLLAAVHMFVEALFWFHPLVWWMGTRLNEECERACDEAVLASGQVPRIYAESILKICKYYLQSPLPFVQGISGATLKDRIDWIIRNPLPRQLSVPERILLVGLALGSMMVPMLAHVSIVPQVVQTEAQTQAAPLSDQLFRQRRAEQAAPRKVIAFDPKDFRKFVGTYQLDTLEIVRVTQEDSHYFAHRTGFWRLEIFPESPNKFFATAQLQQFSFNSDANGRITGLVYHLGGFEMAAPRISADAAKRIEDALAYRIKNNLPSPGTEAVVRKEIELVENGAPYYSLATPQLAALMKEEHPTMQQMIDSVGTLKSVAFRGVGEGGWDIYHIQFDHGQIECQMMPLSRDGKIEGQLFRMLH